jgi:hypothetical protein
MTALSFRDYQNAQSAFARAPKAMPYSAPADVLAARWDAGINMGTTGSNLTYLEATNRFRATFEQQTGLNYLEEAKKVRDAFALSQTAQPNFQPSNIPPLDGPEIADMVRQKYLRENPPPAVANMPPPTSVVADEIARTSEEVANELSARAGWGGEAAGLAADLASAMISPEALATVAFTPIGVAAVGGRAVLKIAGREAVVGAGVEIPAQAIIQTRRQELGFDGGFWQGAMNVAVVGGLSGALGGVIRGVVEARNALRANRTVPGGAARRLYEDLSPGAQRDLENASFDVRVVADVVTRQYETNPRFRHQLRAAEREAIERAIQVRDNMVPFQPRNRAEMDTVEAAIREVGASLETGLPFRPETLRAVGEVSSVPTPRRIPEPFLEHAPEELKAAVHAMVRRHFVDPAPAEDTAGFRFSKGQRERFDELLRQEGRSAADARAVIDAGEARVGARGQITKQTVDDLEGAFARLPREMAPRRAAPTDTTPPAKTVADLQGRPADLPPGDATTVRLSDMEMDELRRKTDPQRAEEGEALLRARAGLPAREAGEAEVPPFLRGVDLDDLNYSNGLREVAEAAGVDTPPGRWHKDVIAEIKAKYPEAFRPKPYDFRGYRDTREEGTFYHGSSQSIESLDEFSYASLNYYGQGFYTSNAIDVVHGYASRGTQPSVYRVSEASSTRLYDMEQPLTVADREAIRSRTGELMDEALDENPANLRELYDEVRALSASRGVPADEVQEDFSIITEWLEGRGFGGLQHKGGLRTGVPEHTVRIYFSPREQLELSQVSLDNFRAGERNVARREFTTAKGSVYVAEGASTTRNKAPRSDPGHEGDSGLKRPSARTVYLESNPADLSAAGLQGGVDARVLIRGDKAALLLWNEAEGRWGVAADMRAGRGFSDDPEIGRYPLELWDVDPDFPGEGVAYRTMHAGNEIVSVTRVSRSGGTDDVRVRTKDADPVAKEVVREVDEFRAIEEAAEVCRNG